MDNIVKKHIEFFDQVTLFADYWIKNSDLQVTFHLSSEPSHSKVTFFLPPRDNDQIVVFKQHVLRHFEKHRLTNKIEISQRQVVVFMIEDGNDQEISTWKQFMAKGHSSSCTLWLSVHSRLFQNWPSCYWSGILQQNIHQKSLSQSEQWEKSKRHESSWFKSKIWSSLIEWQVSVCLSLHIALWERTQAVSIRILLWLHLQSRDNYLGGENHLWSQLFHPDFKNNHLMNAHDEMISWKERKILVSWWNDMTLDPIWILFLNFVILPVIRNLVTDLSIPLIFRLSLSQWPEHCKVMCKSLEISFGCFCESRVFEVVTYKQKVKTSTNVNNITYCTCENLELKHLEFGFCQLCLFKIMRCRNIIKKTLLSIQKKLISDIFYNNSVRIFVDRKIKFESCSSRLILEQRGFGWPQLIVGKK